MELPEIRYETDNFADILAKDSRFDPRAYDFVLRVIAEASDDAKGHVTGMELLDYFRDLALVADDAVIVAPRAEYARGQRAFVEDGGAVVSPVADAHGL